jgi:hypothetical protein
VYFRDDGTLRFAECQREVVAKANDPEHAHRLAACWNAFLQAETTEIERIDDGLSDMNDVLLAGGGWHVLQHQQVSPRASVTQIP